MASYDDTATVSGSIVRVNDGADSVGLKNWLVTLPASLSGYSAIGFNKGGANFIELYTRDNHNGVDYSINADGSLHRYGTASGNSFNNPNATNYSNCPFKLRAGTYTLSVSGSSDNSSFTSLGIYLASGASFTAQGITGNGTKTFTVSEDFGAWYYIKTNSGVTVNDDVYIWISAGSTADAYEPYEAPTQYTASLGRTIYGGTVDIVTGEGEENCTNRNLVGTGFTWVLNTTDASFPFFTIGANAPNKASNKNFVCEGYVNNGNYRSNLQDGEIGVFNNTTGINRFCVRDDSCTTLEQFLEKNANTKITYEVTTPETFTFTPITAETELGTNNFWADEGNTELTYYKDGYGTTSVTIHKETPEGEPVEETRKLHRIIYEGQVDVISGTGLIYRGESGTQYDPPEQISFTPIEVSTDEGENTLYADEGDSAITYRKEI